MVAVSIPERDYRLLQLGMVDSEGLLPIIMFQSLKGIIGYCNQRREKRNTDDVARSFNP